MAIKCPSCGGHMAFNVPTQALKCSYCSSDMSIDDYCLSNEADIDKDMYTVTVYKCPNCGAELSAPDDQTVAYCSYCGGESTLTMKQEEVIRPARIIPFKISKEQAVKTYEEALKPYRYVPKELKEGEHLDSFRGIYIPYLSYEVDVPDNALTLKATKSYTKGKWDYREEYDIDADVGGTIKGIGFDASSSFDDSIAREIAPFNVAEKKDFNEAYVAGFYSDKLTTPHETYGDTVEEMAIDTFYKSIGERAGDVNITAPKDYAEKKNETGIAGYRHRVDLFPVWFLTWKHKGRVAYSVMNGQTGKLSMDIPVNTKTFFMVSGIVATILFVILSLIPIFILPKTISWVAAAFLMVSSIVFYGEIAKIYYRENHIYDLGNVHAKKGTWKKATSTKRKNAIVTVLIGLSGLAAQTFYLVMNLLDRRGNLFIAGVYAIALLTQIILFIMTTKKAAKIEKKTAFIPMLMGVIVLGTGLTVGVHNPVYDYWYYGMAILCLFAMLANMVSMIRYLNYLTTRPVPDFFRREGADHGNKKRSPGILLLTVMLVFLSAIPAFADETTVIRYTANNGNRVVIDDAAELLTEEERTRLLENMKAVTKYGHAAFITVHENYDSAERYAKVRYAISFGEQSGTLFLIDMDNRKIQFYSDGKFTKSISSSVSNEIADIVYPYATREEYFECANEAFNHILIVLMGGRISTPMKYVTNALMALCVGLLSNFLYVTDNRKRNTSIKELDKRQVIEVTDLREKTDFIKNVTANMTSQKKTRHSSSSSGGRSGGGRSRGGGSSGGHSF